MSTRGRLDNWLAWALAASLALAFFSLLGIRWYHEIQRPVTPTCDPQEYILRSPSTGTMTMLLCPETAAEWGVEAGPKDVPRPDLTAPLAPTARRHPGGPG